MESGIQRIGLFGGSFNPVHRGHLLVAQAAREELRLDRLYFIPAAQSPFKPEMAPALAKDRLRLLRLALAGFTYCEIDDQELVRGGISFTIDTLNDYAKRYPQAELYCLIGADHAPMLPKWRQADDLARLAIFAVVPRPGQPAIVFPPPFRGVSLQGFPLGISSSQIRERIQAGLPLDGMVPDAVAEAIRNFKLYL
jgi:nicotinate-nucleotide adenylyltransferase